MGAPAINYSAPRVAAQNITAPASNLNVNEVLGLQSSPYSGLQQVGGQNLYYDEGGGFYESYNPSPRQYGRMMYGRFSPIGITAFGQSYQPSYSPVFGYGGGVVAIGGDEAGTIRKDGQAFKPYSGDIPTGFVETDDGVYEPSMAYIYSQQMPQVAAQPNRTFSTPGYQAAVGNLLGNLAMSGTGGAGRFLGGNVPALNLGTPSGKTAG